MTFPKISFTDAQTGKRVRVSDLRPGDALVPIPPPEPILGHSYHVGHLTGYVSGTTPLALRAAHEEGRPAQGAWLVDELPAGIREIDLPDCRREFRLLQKAA